MNGFNCTNVNRGAGMCMNNGLARPPMLVPGFVTAIPAIGIKDTEPVPADVIQDKVMNEAIRGGARPPPPNRDPADWECPNSKCRNINFKKRSKCNLCGSCRPDQTPGESAAATVPLTIQGPPGLFKAGDWACPSCGNVNWDWRDRCNICNNLKPELQDKREGGRGGGYFDRQDPQDKKAWDSDEEIFDEFGRKKKKKGGERSGSNGPINDPAEKARLLKEAQEEKKRKEEAALERLKNRGKEPITHSPERNARASDRDAAGSDTRRSSARGSELHRSRDGGRDRDRDRGGSRRFEERGDRDRGGRDRDRDRDGKYRSRSPRRGSRASPYD